MKPLQQYFCMVPFVFQYFTKWNLGFFLKFEFWHSWKLTGQSTDSNNGNKYFKLNIARLRISSGGRQTSWLLTSVADKLTGLRWSPDSGHWERDLNLGPPDFHAGALTTRSYCLLVIYMYFKNKEKWLKMTIKLSYAWFVPCMFGFIVMSLRSSYRRQRKHVNMSSAGPGS